MMVIFKIGRYRYERIPINKETGEPKIDYSKERDLQKLFTLVDYDGEPIEYLRRL